MVDRKNMLVEDLIMSQLQNEEKFTDQRSFQTVFCRTFQTTVETSLPQAFTCRLAQL